MVQRGGHDHYGTSLAWQHKHAPLIWAIHLDDALSLSGLSRFIVSERSSSLDSHIMTQCLSTNII